MRAALVVLLVATVAAAADPPGTPKSRAAIALCHSAGDAPADEQDRRFADALRAAEDAVAADDGDALAHFAVFCSLGGQMRRSGAGVRSLVQLRRLRREVDRTLELAPDFADALTGKGSLLLDAPRIVGGDPAEGERLLRRALAVDPEYLEPRLALARALAARGARDEARAEATRALDVARRGKSTDDVAAAQKLVDELAH